ncbi:MAG: hypothetical protein AB1545_01055 [Thermodesulfobacteriota bacterium]
MNEQRRIELFTEFATLGEAKVRHMVETETWLSHDPSKHITAKEWLIHESTNREAREDAKSDRAIAISEEALSIAKEANRIASEDLAAARSSAASAALQAKWARWAAILATIAAIIAEKEQIISMVISWLP